jgi:hypothetical protein
MPSLDRASGDAVPLPMRLPLYHATYPERASGSCPIRRVTVTVRPVTIAGNSRMTFERVGRLPENGGFWRSLRKISARPEWLVEQ